MRLLVFSAAITLSVLLLIISVLELRTPALNIITGSADVTTTTTTISSTTAFTSLVSEQLREVRQMKLELQELRDSFDSFVRFMQRKHIECSDNEINKQKEEQAELEKKQPQQDRVTTRRKERERSNSRSRSSKESLEVTSSQEPLRAVPSPQPALPSRTHENPNTAKKMNFFRRNRIRDIEGDTPQCMNHPLLLLSKQRSGFHFFRSLLDQHPKSRMGTELFCRHVLSYRKTYGELFLHNNMSLTPSQAKAYIQQEMFNKSFTSFTLQAGQQVEDFPYLPQLVKEMNFVAIHLVRKNVLAVAMSAIIDKLTHQPVCVVGQICKAVEIKARVNATRLLNDMKMLKHYQQHNREILNEAGLNWVEIYYEDLVEDNRKICDALKFLGCGCPELRTGTVQKIIQKPFSELIDNWNDVVAKLKGTEFEDYLSS
eukprot:TRINITY_DN16431_c0_g1_i2.p1 TRINITY_DN16431_c0_g1~~TRINITY_DN16431_c0_g1_i2.p1  ORF type:complete len:429 (+),score=95.67 TRINITY_DN16431_c0_g1_i2:57-1343(+)